MAKSAQKGRRTERRDTRRMERESKFDREGFWTTVEEVEKAWAARKAREVSVRK